MSVRKLMLFTFFLFLVTFLYGNNPDYSDNYNNSLLDLYFSKANQVEDIDEWRRITEQGIVFVSAEWEATYEAMLSEDEIIIQSESLDNRLTEITQRKFESWLADTYYRKLSEIDWQSLYSQIELSNDEYLMSSESTSENPKFKDATNYDEDSQAWQNEIRNKIISLADDWESNNLEDIDNIVVNLDSEDRANFREELESGLAVRRILQLQEMEKAYKDCFSRFRRYRLFDSASLNFLTDQEKADQIALRIIENTQSQINQGIDFVRKSLDNEMGFVDYHGEIIDGDRWQEQFKQELDKGLLLWDEAEKSLLIERTQWERDVQQKWIEGENIWSQAFQLLEDGRKDWIQSYDDILVAGQEKFAQEKIEINQLLEQARLELGNNLDERKDSLHSRIDIYTQILTDSVEMVQSSRESWLYWAEKDGYNEEMLKDIEWNQWEMISDIVYDIYDPQVYSNSIEDYVLRPVVIGQEKVYTGSNTWHMEDVTEDRWFPDSNYKAGNLAFLDYFMEQYLPNYNNDLTSLEILQELYGNENLRTDAVNSYWSSLNSTLQSQTKIYRKSKMLNALTGTLNQLFDDEENSQKREAIYWASNMTVYQEYATDSRLQLAESYGIVVSGNGDVDTYLPNEDGEALLELTSDNSNWSEFILDEAEVEVLKALAILTFWEQEELVAQSVLDYAQNNTSGKEKEEETLRKLQTVQQEYSDSISNYNNYITLLETYNEAFERNSTEIDRIKSELATLKDQLDSTRSDMTQALIALDINPDILNSQLREQYQTLQSLYSKEDGEESIIDQSMINYLSAYNRYNMEDSLNSWAVEFNNLVQGDTTQYPPMFSLARLKENSESITINIEDEEISFISNSYSLTSEDDFELFTQDVLTTIDQLGQDWRTDELKNSIGREYARLFSQMTGMSDGSLKNEFIRDSYFNLCLILKPLQEEITTQLIIREEILSIASANEWTDLYGSPISIDEYQDLLEKDETDIPKTKLSNRLEYELGILNDLYDYISLNGIPEEGSFNSLLLDAYSYYIDDFDQFNILTKIESDTEIISSISDMLEDPDRLDELVDWSMNNNIVDNYLIGGSIFFDGEKDYLTLLLDTDEQIIRKKARKIAFDQYKSISPILYAEIQQNAVSNFKLELRNLGIYTELGIVNPQSIANNIENKEEAVTLLNELKNIRRNIDSLPSGINMTYQTWLNSLQEYLTIRLIQDPSFSGFDDPGAFVEDIALLDYQEKLVSGSLTSIEKGLLYFDAWSSEEGSQNLVDSIAYEIALRSLLEDTGYQTAKDLFIEDLLFVEPSELSFFERFDSEIEAKFNSFNENITLLNGERNATDNDIDLVASNNINKFGVYYPFDINFINITELDLLYSLETLLNNEIVDEITDSNIVLWEQQFLNKYNTMPNLFSDIASISRDKQSWLDYLNTFKAELHSDISQKIQSIDSHEQEIFEKGLYYGIRDNWRNIDNQNIDLFLEDFLNPVLNAPSSPISGSITDSGFLVDFYSEIGGAYELAFLKKSLYEGKSLEELGLVSADYPELSMFIDFQKFNKEYKPIIHGSISSYLSSQNFDEDYIEDFQQAISLGRWDDSFFYIGGNNTIQTLKGSFKSQLDYSLQQYVSSIYDDLDLQLNQYIEEKESHFTELMFYEKYLEIEDAQTHYRLNLEENIQVSNLEEILLDDPSFDEIEDNQNIISSADKLSGFLLEYYNRNLRDSKKLKWAFESLSDPYVHPDGEGVWSWSDRIQEFSDQCNNILESDNLTVLNWSIHDTVEDEINDASARYNSLLTKEMSCLESLMYISGSIYSANNLSIENRNEIISEYKTVIEDLQNQIVQKENEWQLALDNGDSIDFSTYDYDDWIGVDLNSLSYSQLESAYKTLLNVSNLIEDEMDSAKQQFNIAQGIYDYASSWYLESEEELLDSENDAYDAVDPESRLLLVRQQLGRAEAAYNAIKDITSGQNDANVYEQDSDYQTLYNDYQKKYRENLALMRINQVLNQGIAEQRDITNLARQEWLDSRSSFFHFNTSYDDFESLLQNSGLLAGVDLSKLIIVQDDNNDFSDLSWDNDSGFSSDQEILDYFYGTGDEGSSNLQQEVDIFFQYLAATANPATQVREWEMAILFEKFLEEKEITYDQFRSDSNYREMLKDYLGTNNVADGIEYTTYSYDPVTNMRTPSESFISFYDDNDDGTQDVGIFSRYDVKCRYSHRTTDRFFEELDRKVLPAYKSSISSENENQFQFYRFLRKAGLVDADGKALDVYLTDYLAYHTMRATRENVRDRHDTYVDRWKFSRADKIDRYDLEDIDTKTPSRSISGDITSRIIITSNKIEANRTNYLFHQDKLENLIGQDSQNMSVEDLANQIKIAFDLKNLDLTTLLTKYNLVDENVSDDVVFNSLTELLSYGDLDSVQAQSEDNSELLSNIFTNSQTILQDSEQLLDQYLYSEDSNNRGLAIEQNNNEEESAALLAEFYESGHLELLDNFDEIQTLDEMILNFNNSDSTERIDELAIGLELFIERIYSNSDSNERSIIRIVELLDAYSEENLDNYIIEAAIELEVYIDSAKLGQDYLAQLELAYLNPIFSEREHLFKLCQDQLELVNSINVDYALVSSEESAKILFDYKVLLAGQQGLNNIQIDEYGLADIQNNGYEKIRLTQLANLQRDIDERENLWNNQMDAILARGVQAWREAQNSLNANYRQWEREFNQAYSSQNETWNVSYIAFNEGKKEWLEDITEQATQVGNEQILEMMGQNTQDKIEELSAIEIDAILPNSLSSDELVRQVLDQATLDQLLSSASSKNSFIGSVEKRKLFMSGGSSYITSKEMIAINDFQNANNDELKSHLGLLQYEQLMDQLRSAQESFDETIANSNRRFGENMDETFGNDGYEVEGNFFTKNVVVGGTISEILREEKRVRRFNFFTNYKSDFDKTILSDDIDPAHIGFQGIQLLIAKGLNEIKKEQEKIFGAEDESSSYIDQRSGHTEIFTELDSESWEELQEAAKGNNNRRVMEIQPGLFNEHIGYAPVFKQDASFDDSIAKNTLLAGKGELGRMMGHFMQNNMIHQAGLAEARKPIYDRKLWDDRGQPFEAPSIRSVSDIAMTVAAGALSGGVGAFAISMIDDVVFAGMDISNGMDAGQIGMGLLKKAATSAVSSAVGGAFGPVNGDTASFFNGGVGQSWTNTFGEGMISQGLKTGAQIYASNIASSAINATQWDGGGFSFDSESFNEGVHGEGAITGYLASMAGSAVTTGITNWGTTTSGGQFLGGILNVDDIKNVAGFTGNLASMAVEYGRSGQTTVNLAGFSYGENDQLRQGLLSIKLGNLEDGEHRGSLGGGGYNMSLGKLRSVFDSMGTVNKLASYKFGDKTRLTELETIAMMGNYGDATLQDHARDIFDGKRDVIWTDGKLGDGTEYHGMEDNGTISLSRDLISDDLSEIAKIASVMGHELSHVDGNNIEALAHEEGAQTYTQMLKGLENAGFDVSRDKEWTNAIVAAMNDPANRVANAAGEEQLWIERSTDDGRLVLDKNGYKDITDEEGNILASHNPELLARINAMKNTRHHLGTEEQIAIDEQISALEEEYNEGNIIRGNNSSDIMDLAKLLSGNENDKTLLNLFLTDENFLKQITDQGFSIDKASGNITTDYSQGLKSTFGMQLDITDLILMEGLEGTDRRSVLANSDIVNDATFENIMANPSLQARLAFGHKLLANPGEAITNGAFMKNMDINIAAIALGVLSVKQYMGVGVQEDGYNTRLNDFLSTPEMADKVKNTMAAAIGFGFNYQNDVSSVAEYGYLGMKNYDQRPLPILEPYDSEISSLCVAESGTNIHDLEMLNYVGLEQRGKFYNEFGKQYIAPDGSTGDNLNRLRFIQAYAEQTGTPEPIGTIGYEFASLFNQTRFSDNRDTEKKHSVVWDRDDNSLFFNPYRNGRARIYNQEDRFYNMIYTHNMKYEDWR